MQRLKSIWSQAVTRVQKAWTWFEALDPRIKVVCLFALLIVTKLSAMGSSAFLWANIQLFLIAVAGGAGFALGWFCSPAARQFRQLIGLIIIGALAFVILGENGFFSNVVIGLVSTAAFIIALSYWFGQAAKAFFAPPTTFGSARWATLEHLTDHDLIDGEGVRLGRFDYHRRDRAHDGDDDHGDGDHRLSYSGDRHLLTVAPTRSGKGTTAIIPNLLTYEGSALVIDPKGENAMITAVRRRQMGQSVHVVDPWAITGENELAQFNPLDWLKMGDVDITENAMLLADALVVPESGSEAFWNEEAKALLQGFILYVATDLHEEGHRHLGRVRDLLLLDGDELKQLFTLMLDSAHHIVASTGARCLQKDEKLLSNVLASAQAQTHFLDSARIRNSLSASDFAFEDLKTKAMTIYLVLPSDRLSAFARWLRLLIQQAITVNARNIDIQPDKPVLFILDEMPSLGRLYMVEQAYGLMAGFGLQLWGIVQDLSQLKRIYGDAHESFIANSGVVQYFGSRDKLTAEYFQALCGVTTVWNLSSAIARAVSTTTGQNGGSTSTSITTTETTSATQRQLAYADELMRLKGDQQLLFVENCDPIIGRKQPWFADDDLKTLGRNLREELDHSVPPALAQPETQNAQPAIEMLDPLSAPTLTAN